MSYRAIIFTSNGPPSEVVRVRSFPKLQPPQPGSLNIRFRLAPINPSDINVVEGVYPTKPEPRSSIAPEGPGSANEPCFIVGNEGVAEVTEIGEGVSGLKPGDRVVPCKAQSGTWSSDATVQEQDVIKVPDIDGKEISDVHAATIIVCS